MREGLSRTLMQGACALRLAPRGLRLAACGLRLCNTTTGCALAPRRLWLEPRRLWLEPRRLWLVACASAQLVACALQLVVVFLQHNLRLHATWGCDQRGGSYSALSALSHWSQVTNIVSSCSTLAGILKHLYRLVTRDQYNLRLYFSRYPQSLQCICLLICYFCFRINWNSVFHPIIPKHIFF